MRYIDKIKQKDLLFWDAPANPERNDIGTLSAPITNEYAYPYIFDSGINKWAQFTEAILGCLETRSTKVFANEIFGNNSLCDLYKYNMLHLLYNYLTFIEEERILDNIRGDIYDTRHYYDLYNIECIANKFKCMGCDIQAALKLFGLSKDDTQCLHQMTLDVCTLCEFESKYFKRS